MLDQNSEYHFYSAGSLKQHSADRHVTPVWQVILTPRQPVFIIIPECYVINGEATKANS